MSRSLKRDVCHPKLFSRIVEMNEKNEKRL